MFRSQVTRVSLVITSLLVLACVPQAGEVTVAGQVLGPDGAAVVGAEVFATYYSPQLEAESVAILLDAGGAFSFSAQTWDERPSPLIIAVKDGLALDWIWGQHAQEVTLTLGADPVSCAGTVTDPQGTPIAEATVWLATAIRPDASENVRRYLVLRDERLISAKTDDEGRFEIKGLPPACQVQVAAVAEGMVRAQIPQSWNGPEPLLPAGKQDIVLVLKPGGSTSGRATHDGQPLANIYVDCYTPAQRGYGPCTITNEDGTYLLDHLPPGIYTVMVKGPDGLTAKAVEHVQVKAGERAGGVDFTFTPGGVVKGTVAAADTGQPIAGAKMATCGPARPERAGGWHQSAETDEAGNYQFRLPPGRNKIDCYGTNAYPATTSEPEEHVAEVVEGKTITGLDFILHPTPKIAGQVLLPDGQPAARVHVDGIGPNRLPDDFLEPQTDADGSFELDTSARGMYDPPWIILAQDTERDLVGITFADSAKEPVEIQLLPAAYVLVPVVDEDDEPIPDLPVPINVAYGRGRDMNLPETRTDDNGILRIGPLPADRRLMLSCGGELSWYTIDGGFTDMRFTTLGPGEEREFPALKFKLEGRTVKGWVGDEQNNPVPGAMIYTASYSGRDAVLTDEHGDFELKRLKSHGKVQILAAHPVKPLFAGQQVDPEWGQYAQLILKPTGSAAGVIVDHNDRPVSEATVFISTRGEYGEKGELHRRLEADGFNGRPKTDEAGTWRTDGLIPGAKYHVSVFLPGPKGTRTFVLFTAESHQTVDLGRIELIY